MELIKEAIAVALFLGVAFLILYIGAYVIETARFKVRRHMHVCDNCFETIKKLKK